MIGDFFTAAVIIVAVLSIVVFVFGANLRVKSQLRSAKTLDIAGASGLQIAAHGNFEETATFANASLEQLPLNEARNALIKRVFDIAVGLICFVFMLPLLAFIALLVYVVDRGPVLYRHRRIGLHGKPFDCLKFRTMRKNSDSIIEEHLANNPGARDEWARTLKLRSDPRVLPYVGHILRRMSLDELPQFINVIRGEMSIIGPRPVTKDELYLYEKFIFHYLSVRPGLAGPWQLSLRNDITYSERVKMDVEYVRNWSLSLDLRLLILTWRVILNPGRGVY